MNIQSVIRLTPCIRPINIRSAIRLTLAYI